MASYISQIEGIRVLTHRYNPGTNKGLSLSAVDVNKGRGHYLRKYGMHRCSESLTVYD